MSNENTSKYDFLFYIIIICICILVIFKEKAINYAQEKAKNYDTTKLYDISQEFLPERLDLYWVGDIIIILLSIITSIYLTINEDYLTLLRIICLVLLCNVAKLILNSVTVLPDPSGICKKKERGILKFFVGSCNDLMPSGHMFTAFAILFLTYGIILNKMWFVLLLNTILLLVFTLISRNHYTIDTLVSLLLVGTLTPLVKLL